MISQLLQLNAVSQQVRELSGLSQHLGYKIILNIDLIWIGYFVREFINYKVN
jgi:hypothetical protein